MSKSFHICVSIRGMMRTDDELRSWVPYVKDDAGRPMTFDQLKASLFDRISSGEEVLPTGGCDDFDVKTGCRGHQGELP